MGVGGTAPALVQINRTAQPLTTDTPFLQPQEPALSCSRIPLLVQQALNPLPNSKCIPPSGPELAASKTNPEPDKPLALKSRVVVEFTADDGLVTRNKSTSPFFR